MRLYEFILTEATRVAYLATKYEGKILARASQDHSAEITKVSSFLRQLESQFGKVIEWVLLKWLQGDFLIEDLPRVETAISQFEQKKRGLEKKDINQYKTLAELEDAVEDVEEIKSNRQLAKDARADGLRIIVDNNRILLAQVLTEEAAIEVGRGTEWCTAYTKAPNRFNHYNDWGPVYYLYDKQANAKYQIHYQYVECKNAKDREVSYYDLLEFAPELRQIEPTTKRGMSFMGFFRYIFQFRGGERWPEVEDELSQWPDQAMQYASSVIKGRWPEAEPYIMKDPGAAIKYAKYVLNSRWPEAEPYIMQTKYESAIYRKEWGIKE